VRCSCNCMRAGKPRGRQRRTVCFCTPW
jgi:hypothetical protein